MTKIIELRIEHDTGEKVWIIGEDENESSVVRRGEVDHIWWSSVAGLTYVVKYQLYSMGTPRKRRTIYGHYKAQEIFRTKAAARKRIRNLRN